MASRSAHLLLATMSCAARVEELNLPECDRGFVRVPMAGVEGGEGLPILFTARASGRATAELIDPETEIGALKAREISPAILRLLFAESPPVFVTLDRIPLALTSSSVMAEIDSSASVPRRSSIEIREAASGALILASWIGAQPAELDLHELDLVYEDGRYCRLKSCGYVDRDLHVRAGGEEVLLDPNRSASIVGFRVTNAQSQRHGDDVPQGCHGLYAESVSGYIFSENQR